MNRSPLRIGWDLERRLRQRAVDHARPARVGAGLGVDVPAVAQAVPIRIGGAGRAQEERLTRRRVSEENLARAVPLTVRRRRMIGLFLRPNAPFQAAAEIVLQMYRPAPERVV